MHNIIIASYADSHWNKEIPSRLCPAMTDRDKERHNIPPLRALTQRRRHNDIPSLQHRHTLTEVPLISARQRLRDKLKECIVCPRTNRKEETVMAQLHSGHSFITHSFLLKGEEPPMCIGCDKHLTIEHILLTCSDFIEIREPLYR